MLLHDKHAIIYGGGGAIGGAIARAFARAGAHVHLAGRTRARLDAVARDLAAAGGRADVAEVDALDERAVDAHADAVAAAAGRIDVAVNAVGLRHVQGTPLAALSLAELMQPVDGYVRSNFITARAVARHMARRGAGVILTLSTPGARLTGTGFLGNGVASAAVEAMSRILAGELGGSGIRVICVRPHAIPEAVAAGSHARDVFGPIAERNGLTIDEMLAGHAGATLLGRLPTLGQAADVATFLASDGAAAMTGTVANLTAGTLVD